jgi:hypothetical protein
MARRRESALHAHRHLKHADRNYLKGHRPGLFTARYADGFISHITGV